MAGFSIGDYVIVSHPGEFTDYVPGADTFKITDFGRNLFGAATVRVTDIATPDGFGSKSDTVFYPHELSWEDGTRPAV